MALPEPAEWGWGRWSGGGEGWEAWRGVVLAGREGDGEDGGEGRDREGEEGRVVGDGSDFK